MILVLARIPFKIWKISSFFSMSSRLSCLCSFISLQAWQAFVIYSWYKIKDVFLTFSFVFARFGGFVSLFRVLVHAWNNLLFSYYELGFRCFELNLFSHCFDSVWFEKFKPEQALWMLDWKDSLFTRNSIDLTWNVSNLCCLRFKIGQQLLSFKNEQSHT